MSCSIGAWGWRHPEWEKDVFYPDDLPEDWQLSYYSNEFDLLVVPASDWSAEGYGEDDWLDDVEDKFVFYIDWPFQQLVSQQDYLKCAESCRQLGEQLAAVLVNDSQWQQLGPEQQEWFKSATEGFDVKRYGSEPVTGNKLLLLCSNSSESLRDLGERLKKLLQSSDIEHIVLADENVNISRLKELKTIVELLGF
ncbi:MAG: hypothetical protein KAU21_02295 [Gammaproteobacteria bacterium]|nr:hypothetical protein [Gammaproteobacteria bacterium]